MFTGLVQAVGRIQASEARGGDRRLRITAEAPFLAELRPGDSVAVSGVCLTALDPSPEGFWADVSAETLSLTTLGELRPGDRVNLEPALTLATPLGGHLVSGHVDGLGEVVAMQREARSVRLTLKAPTELARYIAPKGSICVDGVSLTVNAVEGVRFQLNIVPHTQAVTTLGEYRPGRRVNLEVDLIARYLERLLLGERAAEADAGGMTREWLARCGFSVD